MWRIVVRCWPVLRRFSRFLVTLDRFLGIGYLERLIGEAWDRHERLVDLRKDLGSSSLR